MNTARASAAGNLCAVERLLFLMVAVLIVACTLSPFDFTPGIGLRERISEAAGLSFEEGLFDAPIHVIGFFLLGALGAFAHRELIARVGFRHVVFLAAVLCFILESLQLFVPERHARVTDLLFNFVAVWMGAYFTFRRISANAHPSPFAQRVGRLAARFPLAVLVVGVAVWFSAGIFPISRLSRLEWDRNFHLLIGNEVDATEPWLGEIRFVGIYDRALASDEIQNAARRSDAGLLAGYDFTRTRAQVIAPLGSASDALSMDVPGHCEWVPGGGLLLKNSALLSSRGPDSALTEAIMASAAFSIVASVRPLVARQNGPARIVSLSEGIWSRNFMLGQEDADLVFRVRNGVNGTNGLKHAARARNAVRDSLQQLAVVYDHGVSLMFRDGHLLKPVIDLREPNVYLSLGSGVGSHIASAVILLLAVAMPVCALFSHVSLLQHIVALFAAFLIGSLPYAICCRIVGGPWRFDLFLSLAIVLLLLYPVCVRYVFPAGR